LLRLKQPSILLLTLSLDRMSEEEVGVDTKNSLSPLYSAKRD
jgi:hypothetical protein